MPLPLREEKATPRSHSLRRPRNSGGELGAKELRRPRVSHRHLRDDDDWKGKFDFLKGEGMEVVYLPREPEISTTQIEHDLRVGKDGSEK